MDDTSVDIQISVFGVGKTGSAEIHCSPNLEASHRGKRFKLQNRYQYAKNHYLKRFLLSSSFKVGRYG
jgi:hypothetical protein